MKGALLRILVLLWVGWYISGPVAETFDFWDTPRQEMADVLHSAGGLVALVGVSVAVTLSQARKLRERFHLLPRRTRRAIPCVTPSLPVDLLTAPAAFTHSPPVTLRI